MGKTFTDNRVTARDLQIGDYFYLKPRGGEKYTVVRINGITRRKFGYVDESGHQKYVRYCEDRLAPINLHEGFIFDTLFTDDVEYKQKMIYNQLRKYLACIFDIKYIHELQHILNLRNPYNKFHLTMDNVLDYGREEK